MCSKTQYSVHIYKFVIMIDIFQFWKTCKLKNTWCMEKIPLLQILAKTILMEMVVRVFVLCIHNRSFSYVTLPLLLLMRIND